jgi:hypothetical protein
MQEPFKFCPACGAQNHLSAGFCHACGAQSPPVQAAPAIQKQPKKQSGNTLLIICGVMVFGCAGLTAIGSLMRPEKNAVSTSFATPTPSATPDGVADAPKFETEPGLTPTKSMPKYSQTLVVAEKLGFELYGQSNPDSTFTAEAERYVDGRKYTFVVMGRAGNSVSVIRIEAWGPQTKQARQQLEEWATEALSLLNRGRLPGDVVQKLYAGATIGDGGISNGFCNVRVLQKPVTPGSNNENDRITVDLIFDKVD